ncbi:hypothetical protein L1887_21989 [Cichorium endivia]|nr:hypothetical protein L1887_21989 [Cichorium endivia]
MGLFVVTLGASCIWIGNKEKKKSIFGFWRHLGVDQSTNSLIIAQTKKMMDNHEKYVNKCAKTISKLPYQR